MKNTSFLKRMIALVITVTMVIGLMPNFVLSAKAAQQTRLISTGKVADPSSFDNWQDYYGDNALLPDGSRGISTWKAGGVWTDKSVYTDNTELPTGITMDDPANNFLVALSALASNKEIVGHSSNPTDTMLVLDLSQSMDNSGSVDEMVQATNDTLHALLQMNANNRVGVVLYSGNTNQSNPAYKSSATVILPLDRYTTSTSTTQWEQGTFVTKYHYLSVSGDGDTTVSVAQGTRNSNNQRPSGSKNTNGGTYIQNGLFQAWETFEAVADKGVVQSGTQKGTQRTPIVILMSDGAPTIATTNYYNIGTSNTGDGTTTTNRITFLTQLTAAWTKGKISAHYNNTAAKFYTIGLGTATSEAATAVLSPDTASNDTLQGYWTKYNQGATDNQSVKIIDNYGNDNDWSLTYQAMAETVGKNYVDEYWAASDADEMIDAFQQIVEQIGLQSAYSATLVEKGEADLDGYITVQDELGSMMQVKDIKGILLGNTLFSGEEMAKSLNTGALGDAQSATEYGHEFVRTVQERLGLVDKTGASGELITATAQAQQLIQAAYMDKQLTYNATTGEYSNYIGWYGDADNAYLGFWDKETGITAIGAPAGAKYINRSYGYLGGASTEENAADMMHIVVMVHTEISTGHQTVLFKIPSSLIPMVEYKVELEGDSLQTATNITLTVTEKDPIRLVYEVGLPEDINSINIDQKVAQYLARDGSNHIHKDANGNYVFYANGWDDNHDDVAPIISDLSDAQKLALTRHVAESHFVPNTVNERFYTQEDAVVYTKDGSTYTPVTSGIDASGTYYFPRTVVTVVNGTAQAVTHYEQLEPATIQNSNNFQKDATTGYWQIKAGTILQALSNVVAPKAENKTDTLANADQLWVNVTSSNASDYNVFSFLGNNGKLTVIPATGIKVTKDLTEVADGAAADEKFPITVTVDAAITNVAITDVQGNLLTNHFSQVTGGKTVVTLNLADGESVVISGLPGGVTYTVSEAAHKKYIASYTGATATVAGTIVENTVTNTPVAPGGLNITKEVVHAHDGLAFPTDHDFEFQVTFVDADGNPIVNTQFQLENNHEPTLTQLTTDANGVMEGKLRHGETVYIKGIPAGAKVTVKEINIPSQYASVSQNIFPVYSSINQSGETPNQRTDYGEVTIVSGKNATVEVLNTYIPDPVSVTVGFEGIKNFDATNMGVNSEFTFKLQTYENGKWTDVEGKSVTVIGGTNASETFQFADLDLQYVKPGVHSYRIVEELGQNPDITYDRSVYSFSVNATLDGQGNLKAEVEGHNTAANVFEVSGDSTAGYTVTTVFTNRYHSVATSIAVEKTVDDKANSGKTAAGFVIEAYEATVDANDNWTIGNLVTSTVTDAQGKAMFVRNYDNTDFINNDTDGDNKVTYHFVVKEKNEGVAGWKYDATEYQVTVVLTKDPATQVITSDFKITKVDAAGIKTDLNTSGDTATIAFANTYEPGAAAVDLDVIPTVLKTLDGRELKAGEFTFAIFKDGQSSFTNTEQALMIGTNHADGHVSFAATEYGVDQGLADAQKDTLRFSAVGKYALDIVEIKGNLGGVTYSSTIYDLVVEVTDHNGTLQASFYFVDSVDTTVTFRNTYTAKPAQVVIEGMKHIQVDSGVKALSANMFTFGLYENGVKKDQTQNLANGSFVFDAIAYSLNDAGKTFTYTVKEIAPDGTTDGSYGANGMDYSGQSFDVEVKVIDNGDGTLSTQVTGNGTNNIRFVNVYKSNLASVTLNGVKTLDGRKLTSGEYRFALYTSNETFTQQIAIVQQNGQNYVTNDVDGKFAVSVDGLDMGDHYYILKEIIPDQRAAGIHYDASAYHITVRVSDIGNGQMDAMTTVVHTGQPNVNNPAITFKNVYSPEPGELPLSGSKTYNGGKALEDDVFSVGLYEGANQLQTAKIKANGTFAFENLQYQASDVGHTYTYTIREIIPNGATANGDGTFTYGSNIYDGTEYTLTVTVTDDDKDGALNIASALTKNGTAANALTFTNTFVPDPVSYSIQATKTYEKGLKGGDFAFKLVSIDGKTNVDQTKENAANGEIKFDAISFGQAGTYKFKLTEKKDGIFSFILPSQAEYEITVTVVNENGVLRVADVNTVNIKNTGETNLGFINTYVLDGEDEITLRGTKLLKGDRTKVEANEFSFGLYNEAGTLIEEVKNDASGNFAFATLKFDEKDVPVNGSKQITYTVKEIAGTDSCVTYDATVYTVTVTVKDNDEGGVTASYTVNGNAAGAITFTNTYTAKAPSNPKTADNLNLHLWFMLLLVSGGGVITLAAADRKKKLAKEEQ